jgi:hypothetical protein
LASRLQQQLADRLMELLGTVETHDWIWFEEGLSYDNARFCEALIVTGLATGTTRFIDSGLRTLDWLMARQTGASGFFRPVGTDGFHDVRTPPRPFDQQPVEAAATISACGLAYRASGNLKWKRDAMRAFGWFLGENDLALPLVDVEAGSCRDGLHPDRRNENRGGESVVSYLLGLAQIRALERITVPRRQSQPPQTITRGPLTWNAQPSRGRLVPSHVSKPPGTLPAT